MTESSSAVLVSEKGEGREEGIPEGQEETFGGDGCTNILDLMKVLQTYTYIKTQLYTLNMCSLLYVSYTSTNQGIKERWEEGKEEEKVEILQL